MTMNLDTNHDTNNHIPLQSILQPTNSNLRYRILKTNNSNRIVSQTINNNLQSITNTVTNKQISKISQPKWTNTEEEIFKRGLELYGRDWEGISIMNGLDNISETFIIAHAQKHFIKLYKNGLPLPNKVKETGNGYTISGKPLDPNDIYKPESETNTKTIESYETDIERPNIFAYEEPEQIYSNGNSRNPFNSKVGIAYSYPMDKEGFTSKHKAMTHLAPIWIRPSNLKTFNSGFNDDTNFKSLFQKIWLSKYALLHTQNDMRKNIDVEMKINENIQIDTKIPINYSKNNNYDYKFEKNDYHFLPETYNVMAMPNIDKELVKHRKFNVVYFDANNICKTETNAIIKKWSLVDGNTRKEIFENNDGVYKRINNLSEIFEIQNYKKTNKEINSCTMQQ
eukprot:135702_1